MLENIMEDFLAAELLADDDGNPENISDFSMYNRTDGPEVADHRSVLETSVGLLMAVLGNFFVGISIVIRRRALQNVAKDGQVRASEGGYGYWKSGTWWLGTLSLLLAQVFMFESLILAPAILVAPVGVVRILTASVAARYVLKEKMKSFGWLGCFLVICGCVIFIISGPKDKDISTMEEFNSMFQSPSFLFYLTFIGTMTVVLLALAPRYGSRYMLLYVFIEGGNGSVSMWLGKGMGVGLSTKSFSEWTLWVCVILLLASLGIQFIVNNRSADLFDAALIMSSSYVVLTTGVILVSLILFSSQHLTFKDSTLMILGFLVNVIGLVVMMKGKDIDINLFETVESHDPKNNIETNIQEKSVPPQSNKPNRDTIAPLHIARFMNKISKIVKVRGD